MSSDAREKRDLVLAPGSYAYMQDVTTGMIKTFVGPCVINQTAQEVPVSYESSSAGFRRCGALEEAVSRAPMAPEGYYLVLNNPVDEGGETHPPGGGAGKVAPRLQVGRKINLPGPCMFALWPGQDAKLVRGHHLRSNQYLLVRVYNEEEARANWSEAVIKPAAPETSATSAAVDGAAIATAPAPPDLALGKLLIIRGTEVSFYIPPTGIGVVPEGEDSAGGQRYVRDALTLERLEYCILVDQNGNKRYERGPQVVFPVPTETFITNDGQRKFRAIELSEVQGLHIKVIAPYVDDDSVERREGDELFVTGRETAIYFPREEHSIVRYDGQSKHFATAIPAGEGRYVMDRVSGEIETVAGPAMLLPDPRRQVIVRRALSDREVRLWYPGDDEALEYNRHLRGLLSSVPTTRAGVISEGDYTRGSRKSKKGRKYLRQQLVNGMQRAITGSQELVADEFTRAADYAEPRSVTIDTRFSGVPAIDVWPGRAVMVVSKTGARRVEQGPTRVLLRYDESLAVVKRAVAGADKSGRAVETVFLWTANNKVTDLVEAESADGASVAVTLTYTVDFEEDPQRWFAVENYAQLLGDRLRPRLRAAIKAVGVQELFERAQQTLDSALGTEAELRFGENGMRLVGVQVEQVLIDDDRIRELLDSARQLAVEAGVEISRASRELDKARQLERLRQQTAEAKQQTDVALLELSEALERKQQELALAAVDREAARAAAEQQRLIAEADGQRQLTDREIETESVRHAAGLARRQDEQNLQMQRMRAQTESVVAQASALSPHLSASIERLADEKLLTSLAGGFGELAAAKGVGLLEAAKQFFDFLPDDKLQVVRHAGGRNGGGGGGRRSGG